MMPYSKVAVESFVLLPLFHSPEKWAYELLSKGTWSSRRLPVKNINQENVAENRPKLAEGRGLCARDRLIGRSRAPKYRQF